MLKETLVLMTVVALCLAGVTHDIAGPRGAVAEAASPAAFDGGDLDLDVAATAYKGRGHYDNHYKGHNKGYNSHVPNHNKGHNHHKGHY